jgi:anti-sigma regulatory factor (Ser/Thr protein kinase)
LPENVSTARIFGAAIARHFGCDEADIDDLKIALSEACANALNNRQIDGAESIKVASYIDGRELSFEVEGGGWRDRQEIDDKFADDLPSTQQALAMGSELIKTLFPDAEVKDGPTGPSLRFWIKAGRD